jgi:hypothetical protein
VVRPGYNKAIGVVAHKIATIIWNILHIKSDTSNAAKPSTPRLSRLPSNTT